MLIFQQLKGNFMLGRTKKEKQSAYKGMAIAAGILVFFPASYVWIKDKLPGGQG